MDDDILIKLEDLPRLLTLVKELAVRPVVGLGPMSKQITDGVRIALLYYKTNGRNANLLECVNRVDGVDTKDIYFWPACDPLVYYVGKEFSREAYGSLISGRGKLLVYFLKNIGCNVSIEDIVKQSGWRYTSVQSNISYLNSQLKYSIFYRVDRVGKIGYSMVGVKR